VKSADIAGYRELSQEEVDRVNTIKAAEVEVGQLWRSVSEESGIDYRWSAIAKTHFQEGFTALVRAITKPEDVF
jgi:hypothetical protein